MTYHHNRRHSTAAVPYSIPEKSPHSQSALSNSQNHNHHNHSHSHHNHSHNIHHHHHSQHAKSHSRQNSPNSNKESSYVNMKSESFDSIQMRQLSASVPTTLSREFVVRRISEGETGRLKEELRCEACGKGYKHMSSLAKHLWEHTREWNVTKKLLISKHQQVQLLEAASILVGMNESAIREEYSDDSGEELVIGEME